MKGRGKEREWGKKELPINTKLDILDENERSGKGRGRGRE